MTEPESEVAPEPASEPDVPWQRQDARMLLIHPVKQLIRFFPAVIGLVIAGTTQSDGEPWWFGLVAIGGAVLLGALSWYATRYRITAEQLQLRTGIFNSNTITTPVDRVRTVDVTASLLHRVLGLAEVKIGTGADETKLALDGLPAARAAALRDDLIHLRHAPPADGESPEGTGAYDAPAALDSEVEISRLRPAWIKYALLTGTGIASAAAIFGVGWQIIDRSGVDLSESSVAQQGEDLVRDLGVLVAVGAFVVIGIVLVLALSLLGYVLSYWGYRLTRNPSGGTLQVTRGLFTTRTVTVEERRLRGVQLTETLPMRPAGGAALEAITTGLGTASGESSMLLPPAPVEEARRVTDEVLTVSGMLSTPLRPHGPAATRRRWTRALVSALVLAGIVVGATFWWMPSLGLLAVVPFLAAPWLAHDRAHSLGHALSPRYLLSREGSIMRHTVVLERSGVIGVAMNESFFQRRSGLMTVQIATAAGSGSYEVMDIPSDDGVALAAELLPGHLEPVFEV